jgi:diguanylate cyclase (GGDEF)-like protein
MLAALTLLLPGAGRAHVAATLALCCLGAVVAGAVAVARPHADTLALPAVDLVAAVSMMLALYLTGGLHSPLTPLVVLVLQSRGRPLRRRLATPVLILLSPLLYQAGLQGAGGPATAALLCASVCVVLVVALSMYGTENVLARLNEVSRRRAATDPLTRLANRRAFFQAFEQALATQAPHTQDESAQLAVVMIDLDNFGDVNTMHGHQAGDELLRMIADALRGVARDQDCVARVGGDEFTALLPGAGAAGAQSLAERFVAAVAQCTSLSADETQARVSASAGYAICPVHGTTPDELLSRADAALMEVKRSGKAAVLLGVNR